MKTSVLNLFIIILFKISFLGSTYSQDYFLTNLSKAKELAKKENKLILLDFSATWCMPCKKMEKEVFADIEVKKFLNENFICVKLMHGKKKSDFSYYEVNRFPTIVILESNSNELTRWSGYSNKINTIYRLKSVLKTSVKSKNCDNLLANNIDNSILLYEIHDSLVEKGNIQCAKKISESILKISDNWLEKANMKLIIKYFYKNNKYEKFYYKNKKSFVDSIGKIQLYPQLLEAYSHENAKVQIIKKEIHINEFKNDFIQLFDEESYKIILNYYFFRLFENSNWHRNIYIISGISYIKEAESVLNNNLIFKPLLNLILNISNTTQLSDLYEALKNQFKYQNINLEYFDLKAFLEYKLDMNDSAIQTIKTANKISVERYNIPFKSKFKDILELEKKYRK